MNATNENVNSTTAPVPLIPANHFPSRDAYLVFLAYFRARLNELNPETGKRFYPMRAEDHALYALLRGRDWCRGLAENTCPHHLARIRYHLFDRELADIKKSWEGFGEHLTEEVLQAARKAAKERRYV